MSRISKLSLNLGSHHWKKRITCHAFSNVLSEGVNNFYTLNVLCEYYFFCACLNEFLIPLTTDQYLIKIIAWYADIVNKIDHDYLHISDNQLNDLLELSKAFNIQKVTLEVNTVHCFISMLLNISHFVSLCTIFINL